MEEYDRNDICQPCVVLLNPFSQQDIEKAIKGEFKFTNAVNNSVISSQPLIQTQEIIESEESSVEEQEEQIEDHSSKVPVIPITETPKPQNDLIKNIINEELQKRSKVLERNSSVELNLSESSSEDEEKTKQTSKPTPISTPNRAKTLTHPKGSSTVKSSLKTPTPVKSRSRSHSKRKQISSDSDSDFDITKEKVSVSTNKKRVKFDAIPKTLVNSKSKPKKKLVQLSRRLVASASSESESSEDNRENLRNNSIQKKATTTPKNSETTTSPKNSETTTQVFKCSFCDFVSNQRSLYIMHTTKHKDERKNPILCPECGKTVYSKESLERHKEEDHPPLLQNAILYGCEECKEFSCYSMDELDQHLMSHIEDLSYLKTSSSKHRCALCKVFTAPNQELMSTHLKQKHRMFKCHFDCHFVAPDFLTIERFVIIFIKICIEYN